MSTRPDNDLEYAGFWIRVVASIFDAILIMTITYPLLVMIYGWSYFSVDSPLIQGPADFLISWIFPMVATIGLWMAIDATPGKIAIKARIVDARTGRKISFGQALLRYLCYFLSAIPLGLGFIWVAFDEKKRAWHDLLAGTVVIRSTERGPQPVRFGAG